MSFYCRSDFIFQRKIDNTLCLLKNKDKYVYKLNETASFLWQMLEKETSSEDLSQALSKKYNIPLTQASADVDNFLTYWLKEKLIKKVVQ